MRKIRLLFCVHDFRGRGAEKVLATLLANMNRDKYEIAVFVLYDLIEVELPEDIKIISAHLSASKSGLVSLVRANFLKISALRNVIQNYSPDVTMSVAGTNIVLILAAALVRKKPVVILAEHTMPSMALRETPSSLKRWLTEKILSWTYPHADLIQVPIKGVLDNLTEHYCVPKGIVEVIPNPLDLENIRREAAAKINVCFEDEQCYRIGFVGGLSREKNVPCLLRAFASLRQKKAPVKLYLVGEGTQRQELEEMSRNLGVADAVHFLGFCSNPYALMKRFDVLVVPSFYETFSYVMVEAMACGVPVISTNWPGSEGLYRDCENCLLVPIDQPGAMASAIERLMSDHELREWLVTNGASLAETCAAPKVVEQYQAMIDKVASWK